MKERYLTIKEVADLLGVTPLTLRNWDKRGRLAAYRNPINNYRLYKYADVADLMAEIQQSRNLPSRAADRLLVRNEDEPFLGSANEITPKDGEPI